VASELSSSTIRIFHANGDCDREATSWLSSGSILPASFSVGTTSANLWQSGSTGSHHYSAPKSMRCGSTHTFGVTSVIAPKISTESSSPSLLKNGQGGGDGVNNQGQKG
jgi:type II secretory pathway pseudopilin PulG